MAVMTLVTAMVFLGINTVINAVPMVDEAAAFEEGVTQSELFAMGPVQFS